MSLKTFHILFITISIALAAGFGMWAVSIGGWGYLVTGIGSFACAALLIGYQAAFLRKCRQIGLS
jgi:hypothetical protein